MNLATHQIFGVRGLVTAFVRIDSLASQDAVNVRRRDSIVGSFLGGSTTHWDHEPCARSAAIPGCGFGGHPCPQFERAARMPPEPAGKDADATRLVASAMATSRLHKAGTSPRTPKLAAERKP